jgi:hypothetical protein
MLKQRRLRLICSCGGKCRICSVIMLTQLCFLDYFSDGLFYYGVSAYFASNSAIENAKYFCLDRKVHIATRYKGQSRILFETSISTENHIKHNTIHITWNSIPTLFSYENSRENTNNWNPPRFACHEKYERK